MLDAVRYVVDNGIKWRSLPVDFPPWTRVYAFFRRWRETGLIRELHDRLRERVRQAEGRETEPTAAVVDKGGDAGSHPGQHVSGLVASEDPCESCAERGDKGCGTGRDRPKGLGGRSFPSSARTGTCERRVSAAIVIRLPDGGMPRCLERAEAPGSFGPHVPIVGTAGPGRTWKQGPASTM
ncbi:transposase [Streptomyces sp. NPDC002785]|uniref:transposase n=1 Tax=Streptomyces sp. NPDC002785 TaxID=3154543 RepID=UPI00333451B9